jgi:hypothetical protein
VTDQSQELPFAAVQEAFDGLFPRGRFHAYRQSRYLGELSDGAIDLIAARAHERPTPRTMVATLQMGGAIAKVPGEESAFAARSAACMVAVDGLWTDPAMNAGCIGWVRSAAQELDAFSTGGADRDHWARLAAVKATYDPGNFFRMNRNVAPARTGRAQSRSQS